MKSLLGMLLLGCGVVGAQIWAQDRYDTRRYDPYDRDRGGYFDDRYPQQRGYGYGGNPQAVVGRVLADLDRAAGRARLDGHERKHFQAAAENLREFEGRWARGKFDSGKLDKAIEALAHLAEADRVRGRDRDMLARDADSLRQLRSSRGRYERGPYFDRDWR